MIENQYSYDDVAADQVAYLQLSRAMVKNLFIDIPGIDSKQIIARAVEMAQYDPYSSQSPKIKKSSGSGKVTISDIAAENPEC